jgi:carbon storage regulator
MLVLSRKERERIRVGDSIVVTIVRVSGDKVRIGIEAPSDVLVLRDELQGRAPHVAAIPAGETFVGNVEVVVGPVAQTQVA